jgi:hypothetical protein
MQAAGDVGWKPVPGDCLLFFLGGSSLAGQLQGFAGKGHGIPFVHLPCLSFGGGLSAETSLSYRLNEWQGDDLGGNGIYRHGTSCLFSFIHDREPSANPK